MYCISWIYSYLLTSFLLYSLKDIFNFTKKNLYFTKLTVYLHAL